ncbi:MAG: hypothetical protein WED04_03420 [Promethearchaeati archaeon SRVP18_Atabeyarchaeia-1]
MNDEISESESAAESFRKLFYDPIVRKLLKNSDLTRIQFETILINFVYDETVGKDGGMYDEKGHARTLKKSSKAWGASSYSKGVSRGAFRRVLFQACRNVMRSIYTLFLLGYVGILDTPGLHAYIELSEMVTQYKKKNEEAQVDGSATNSPKGAPMRLLEKSLLKMIDQYASPFNVLGKTRSGD